MDLSAADDDDCAVTLVMGAPTGLGAVTSREVGARSGSLAPLPVGASPRRFPLGALVLAVVGSLLGVGVGISIRARPRPSAIVAVAAVGVPTSSNRLETPEQTELVRPQCPSSSVAESEARHEHSLASIGSHKGPLAPRHVPPTIRPARKPAATPVPRETTAVGALARSAFDAALN